MPDSGRSPSKLLVYALALPIIALAYFTAFGGRLWAAVRPTVATFLGATVIASIYGEEAYRRTPTPVRAASVVFLSLTLVTTSFSAPASVAAASPADAVVAAARSYLGSNYRLGTEGPRTFDCSGLIYRIFADAGELPRIGGMRIRARGYMQYFVSRGRFTKDASEARPGDLVVYNRGSHIGVYVGEGKVISALVQPWGVSLHGLRSINLPVTYILKINWGGGDSGNGGNAGGGGGGGNDGANAGGDNDDKGRPGDQDDDTNSAPDPNSGNNGNSGNGNEGNGDGDGASGGPQEGEKPGGDGGGQSAKPNDANAVALGTMNLRTAADPHARIIGWVGRNGAFKIIGAGKSPAGYDWFEIQTRSGKTGWVYARWVRQL
jgi:cell wall-associated NlpC family hydrolase